MNGETLDRESRNRTMQGNGKAESKRDQGAVGEHPEMSESPSIWSNSNSQTETDSPSTSESGSPTEQTPSGTVVIPGSLLTSRSTASDSSSSSPTIEEARTAVWSDEGEFEMTLNVTIKGYGHFAKEEAKIAQTVMRALDLRFSNFTVTDEIGRTVVWDRNHPERPVFFQQP